MEPPTTLWAPKPANSVIVRRERRAPQPELDAVIGGAPLQTKPQTQFSSYLNARGIGPAPRAGAPQQ